MEGIYRDGIRHNSYSRSGGIAFTFEEGDGHQGACCGCWRQVRIDRGCGAIERSVDDNDGTDDAVCVGRRNSDARWGNTDAWRSNTDARFVHEVS